ncbi:MAG: YhjD/YihY/BrkB family envelope integrity protein [Solirubrobacteraceae bacterium]
MSTASVMRRLTFWLWPDFVVRCLRRFEAVTGFDRAIALSSLAFTAVVPLGMVCAAILPSADVGRRIVRRFGLTGGSATTVQNLFGSSETLQSGFSLFGLFMLIVAVLSFSRAVQRLFETTWELPPLSLRNTLNGLRWIAVLVVCLIALGAVRSISVGGLLGVVLSLALIPTGIVFFVWTGMVLTSHRLPARPLVPGAVLTIAALTGYGIASDIYVSQLFNTSAARYGAIGVTFALISWLFGVMLCIVASTAVGREVFEELESIRRGERPSTAQIDADWARVREQVEQGRAEVARRREAWRARRAGRQRKG